MRAMSLLVRIGGVTAAVALACVWSRAVEDGTPASPIVRAPPL